MPPVTLKQIADALGVSSMTVSRALRGVGHTSPELLDRIRDQAAAMGYQANPIARSLRKSGQGNPGSTGLNLALLEFSHSPKYENFKQMSAAAKARGHSITRFPAKDWNSLAALKRIWSAQGISGVVFDSHSLVKGPVSEELAHHTDWGKFTLIKLGNGLPALAINRVRSSVFTQVTTTYDQVVAKGYRRVAFIFHSSASYVDDQMRLGAVLAAQARASQHGIHVAHWIIDDKDRSWHLLNKPAMRTQLKRFIDSAQPDAVIGFGAIIHAWLKQSGYTMPRDFAFACPVVTPEIHGQIAGTLDDMAGGEFTVALQMLENMLARGERGLPDLVQEHTIPVRWVEGASLPDRAPTHPKPSTK